MDTANIIIIIIVNVYSAYILNNFKLHCTTNKIIWLVIHGDRQKLSLEHGTANKFTVESSFKKNYVFLFLQKVYIVSKDLTVIWS